MGFRKGSESLPLTTLVLRCLGSDVDATEREGDAGFGGFLLASSFLCRSMSSRCWLMPSCCLRGQGHTVDISGLYSCCGASITQFNRKLCTGFSLDQILECVSIGPLLRVGCSVPDGGEVTQAETVLHALFPTRLFLLSALRVRIGGKKKRSKN